MFGGIFRPKSKNYRKYEELFGNGSEAEREKANQFVDSLPICDQFALLEESFEIACDKADQSMIAELRKKIEAEHSSIGFSEN